VVNIRQTYPTYFTCGRCALHASTHVKLHASWSGGLSAATPPFPSSFFFLFLLLLFFFSSFFVFHFEIRSFYTAQSGVELAM
jgi:hypothetical protein